MDTCFGPSQGKFQVWAKDTPHVRVYRLPYLQNQELKHHGKRGEGTSAFQLLLDVELLSSRLQYQVSHLASNKAAPCLQSCLRAWKAWPEWEKTQILHVHCNGSPPRSEMSDLPREEQGYPSAPDQTNRTTHTWNTRVSVQSQHSAAAVRDTCSWLATGFLVTVENWCH